MSDAGFPLPPPSFEFLVLSLKMQAEMRLGLLSFGEEKDAQPDLVGARHAIDMLAMLAAKTHGNLEMDEQRLIENSLTELRFRYVQVSEQAAKTAVAGSSAPAQPAEDAQASESDASAAPGAMPAEPEST